MKGKRKEHNEQRVWEIEHGSFTPLVLSASGGFAREATNFYKTLASKLSIKWDQQYSQTMNWLQCTISFDQPSSVLEVPALQRSCIQMLASGFGDDGVRHGQLIITLTYCYNVSLLRIIDDFCKIPENWSTQIEISIYTYVT